MTGGEIGGALAARPNCLNLRHFASAHTETVAVKIVSSSFSLRAQHPAARIGQMCRLDCCCSGIWKRDSFDVPNKSTCVRKATRSTAAYGAPALPSDRTPAENQPGSARWRCRSPPALALWFSPWHITTERRAVYIPLGSCCGRLAERRTADRAAPYSCGRSEGRRKFC